MRQSLIGGHNFPPVGHGPLSDLDGAELLVVGARQAEAALLPVAPRAASAEAVRRRGQR